jgi:hypothetical protein
MLDPKKLESEIQYVTNQDGKKIAVIVPIEEFVALLEDIEDLAAAAERGDGPSVSHGELLKKTARKRQLAKLPFEEKIEIVGGLQKLRRSVKNNTGRRARKQAADR